MVLQAPLCVTVILTKTLLPLVSLQMAEITPLEYILLTRDQSWEQANNPMNQVTLMVARIKEA
jgi:hypothetical protein